MLLHVSTEGLFLLQMWVKHTSIKTKDLCRGFSFNIYVITVYLELRKQFNYQNNYQ